MLDYNDSQNDDFFEGFTDFLERLESSSGNQISEDKRNKIIEKLTATLSYEPKIGILGKTSAGKSSLCNALFGQPVCEISDIEACTRNPQEVLLETGGKGLTLLDVPGIGENRKTDREYAKLYRRLLPELDLVLWVLKADERAYASDESFYNNIIKPHVDRGKPFLFVLNQCDKIEPFREWDEHNKTPGEMQLDNINQKIDSISRHFNVSQDKIIPISANEGYNLATLVEHIVMALPNDKRITFLKNIKKENWSDASAYMAKRAWYEVLADAIVSIIGIVGGVVTAVLNIFADEINP